MEIKGKVHCFFEQSGTFKQEFIKLGYEAYDYDIQNNFGETDYQIDLFAEIENAYAGKPSIWDNITSDDLVMAFFPCIYFTEKAMLMMSFNHYNYRSMDTMQTIDYILDRNRKRNEFYELCIKMFAVALRGGGKANHGESGRASSLLARQFPDEACAHRQRPHDAWRLLLETYCVLVLELRTDIRAIVPTTQREVDYRT